MQERRTGCLGLLAGLGGAKRATAPAEPVPVAFPYAPKFQFMSPAEARFFGALQGALGAGYLIFPKVRLVDVCYVRPGAGFKAAFNRVVSKHLDYVLCDPTTLKPLVAVELDDSSHQRADRVERDGFVDKVLEAVELPLVRFRVRTSYEPNELRSRIEAVLHGTPRPGA